MGLVVMAALQVRQTHDALVQLHGTECDQTPNYYTVCHQSAIIACRT